MTVSAAKLEANRRNLQRSCGPRTAAGKNRSKLNAVTHGMRAETLVLLDEDPQALEDRRAAWTGRLLPSDDVEQRIVEDAVVSTWQLDRARRAQIARLNLNLLNFGVDQAQANAEEVEELGQRLFNDRLGPLTFYPTGCGYDETDNDRFKSTSFDDEEDDLDRPAALVLRLQATLVGCEWLLGRWAGLKGIIERATERLTLKAEAHRARDEAQAHLASDVLAFDDSPEGERLRRYELAHGRGVARAIELLRKHRLSANPIDRNAATGTGVEFDILQQAHAMAEENTTNEPTVTCENVTNEPTLSAAVGLESPTYMKAPGQNSTNEPTVACENVTNETTVACENVTSEAALAADSSDGESAELTAVTDSSDAEHLHAEVDIEKASEWIRQEVEKRKTIRADILRKMNEASRKEAGAVRSVHRARRGGMGAEDSEPTRQNERRIGAMANASEDKMHAAIGRL